MREQAIEKIMTSHNLPWAIAEGLVDPTGQVDEPKLQAVLLGVSWGRQPAASGDPRLVQALSNAYWDAQGRQDAQAMICLQNRIFKLGGRLLPRK